MKEQTPNQAPKRGLMSYIGPLLFIVGIVALFFLVFGNSIFGGNFRKVTYQELKTIVEDEDNNTTFTVIEVNDIGSGVLYEVRLEYYNDGDKNTTSRITCDVPIDLFYAEIHPDILLETASGDVDYYFNRYQPNVFMQMLPTILLLGGSGILVFIIFRGFSSSIKSSENRAMDFNKSRARRVERSHITFNDVAGAEEEKLEMAELVDYLKYPAKYSKYGAKLPRGVLLVGPPGTGKTLMAKAVAGEAKVPFFSISGSDFVEMFVGVGAGRVRDMFNNAKKNAPCIIFIDEIDAVGRQRGAGLGGGNDEREQTLNQLLVEMDGFSDNSGIIVIAATNREDVLDPALLRPGRFDRQIMINLPDRKAREAIFRVHARNKKIDPTVDFERLAARTVGFSGADIANILNEAAILSVRENKEEITLQMIDEAIDRQVAGIAKTNSTISEHEKKLIAYHESGHAVIGLMLPDSDKVQKITIVPRGRTGGHVRMAPEYDKFLLTKKELLARITGLLGGRTSEELFFDDITTGAQSDIQVATRIARAMVTEFGMSKLGPIQYESDAGSVFLGRDYTSARKNFSSQVGFEIDKEVRSIIDAAHEEARQILAEHRDLLIRIANRLLEKETITAEEIEELQANKDDPKDVA